MSHFDPSKSRQRRKPGGPIGQYDSKDMPTKDSSAVGSTLNSIHIGLRSPKPGLYMNGNDSDVELRLIGNEDRNNEDGFDQFVGSDEVPQRKGHAKPPISKKDKRAMALLIVLYLIQGAPLGLALGSVPFLLKEHLSYSQLAIFALSSYPYSLKLLWSPIVDSVFFRSVGRRKSWIIPMQLIIGTLMMWIASNVQVLLDDPQDNVGYLTVVFTSLVFFSATQDIAVDGWALTLLSEENLSYASTCQTIGLNTGFFASFTVFLALNSEAFTQRWGIPRLTLSAYLRFWAFVCYAVTLWLVFVQKEDKPSPEDEEMSVVQVYQTMWDICKLKHIQSLLMVHFFCKLGFQANDSVTSLKLVEKGLGREDLALAVLIDFPCQIIAGWLAARWSIGNQPLRPWLSAFWVRLSFGLVWVVIVWYFPKPPISSAFFALLVATTVLQGFSNTMQFVGISAFHTRISDPLIGGTYMTLLNTFSNLGGTWPKYFVLKGVDMFTVASCQQEDGVTKAITKAFECVTEQGKEQCSSLGGTCVIEQDGYYITSVFCLIFGVAFLVFYIAPTARRLQALPVSQWRVNIT